MKKEVYWYTKKEPTIKRLDQNASADVCIVGGGMSGLSAADRLNAAGLKVMVLECRFCGGGASGKSSGFLTPDSELQLADLLEKYGPEGAKKMREFVNVGLDLIRDNIKKHNIDCDYRVQDSLFVANSKKSFKKVKDEHEARTKLGYQSDLYHPEKLPEVLATDQYFGGVRYGGSFGLNSYLYCQAMKEVLEKRGVEIFEETVVTEVKDGKVVCDYSGNFTVKAKHIIVATDKFLPDLNLRKNEVYHAQTFLALSQPLSEKQIKKIFPSDEVMVWDTDLIYQYYRLVEDNRLLFGAANLLYTYQSNQKENFEGVIRKMHKYLKIKFGVADITFEYSWPGLIGVTKDFVPIAGQDPKMKSVYYVSGATGLPWAVALGDYIAEKILNNRDDYDKFFTANRSYPISNKIQSFISKPLAFALSHGIVKYFK
ncbi:MAG TPA: FAD-binding oxidoreductase [Candidatus Paceibacterota bacterium]|nr:FAD-binding oxidoreductase [Candidatus Paceibacterota bacterium]